MGYLHENGSETTAVVPAPVAPTNAIDQIVDVIKKLSPLILLIVVIWLLLREENASVKRPNPKWRVLPEWKGQDSAEVRRDVLKRLVGREGYTKVLKRLVAMANLSGNASAKADTNWIQGEFGG